MPQRPAIRAAAVPGRERSHADLRHSRRHQPRPRQLLHDRRVSRVRAGAVGGGERGRRVLHGAGDRRRAVDRVRLRTRMGLRQLPVPARAPAAGADDVWPYPGVRGVAQHPRRRRRPRRGAPRMARGQRAAGRRDDLSGVPAVHVGCLRARGARALRGDRAHADRHGDQGRRIQPRNGAVARRRHPSACIGSCSPRAWPSRCLPA